MNEAIRIKRKAKKLKEMQAFCKSKAGQAMLYQFMKHYSMNEEGAKAKLKELEITITKDQVAYARNKLAVIRLKNKQKRLRKKAQKRNRANQEYEEHVIDKFLETNNIETIDDYNIIKDIFF